MMQKKAESIAASFYNGTGVIRYAGTVADVCI
jgi:hypothetical protein